MLLSARFIRTRADLCNSHCFVMGFGDDASPLWKNNTWMFLVIRVVSSPPVFVVYHEEKKTVIICKLVPELSIRKKLKNEKKMDNVIQLIYNYNETGC